MCSLLQNTIVSFCIIAQSLHWPLPSLRAAHVIDAMIHSTGYMPFSVTLTSASPSLSVIPDSVWAGVF